MDALHLAEYRLVHRRLGQCPANDRLQARRARCVYKRRQMVSIGISVGISNGGRRHARVRTEEVLLVAVQCEFVPGYCVLLFVG